MDAGRVRGCLLVVLLSILLLIAWPFHALFTAGFLHVASLVVGADVRQDWFDEPATEIWQKALAIGYFVAACAVLGIGRAFLTPARWTFWKRAAVYPCLVAAESAGLAIYMAVGGSGERGAGFAGAGFTMLVTWGLLLRWWGRRSSPDSQVLDVPAQVRPARGHFRTAEPAPGHIWWAAVPYDDQEFAEDRPCLVVRTYHHHAEILKITSQDKSDRDDYLRLTTAGWDAKSKRDSWLELYPLRDLDYSAFRKQAGLCDIDVWAQVAEIHGS